MRQPRYLSPTSIGIWEKNREQFYLYYLCEARTPRDPQTDAMAVGSAFDARVKSWLVERLLGKRPQFEFTSLFEAQVEQHNRDKALAAGNEVFDAYVKQGALADLLLDLEGCIGEPRFEASLEAPVSMSGMFGDVPLLGKPDIYFITKLGARIIFDWKVNGYYSPKPVSPKPGYVRQRTADHRTNGRSHDKAMVITVNGIKVSVNHPLCSVETGWAAQLSIYAWLLGEPIGSQFIAAIDQIAVAKDNVFDTRDFRIAQHRSVVTEKFQTDLYKKAHAIWHQIKSGHIFEDRPREESDKQCRLLDEMAEMPPDANFDELLR